VRVGAIDIGTNTVRLLVMDGGGGLSELAREVTITRLGRGVDATGRIDAEAAARTMAVLGRYGSILDELGVARRRAIATSASRDAGNIAEFLDAAEAAAGVRPQVISGFEEAELSFRGTTSGLPRGGVTLVVDLGGGSTEFVAGEDAPSYACSVDIGSVRLAERCLGAQPAPPADVAAARRHVRQLFTAELAVPAVDRIIGVAGTFTALAAMHLELDEYLRERVHGALLTGADLDGLVDRLAALSVDEIAAIPSMDPARAPVILAGAIVAAEALDAAGGDQLTVSEHDILDGVALSLLD